MPVDTPLIKFAHKGEGCLPPRTPSCTSLMPHIFCTSGELESVRQLVEESGVNVDEPGASNRTALHRAAALGHLGVIAYLISKKATVDALDRYNRTPLLWATLSSQSGAVALLLSAGAAADKQASSGMSPLMAAADSGSLPLVQLLLDHAMKHDLMVAIAMCEAKDNEGNTAFHIAKRRRDREMCRFLRKAVGHPQGDEGNGCCRWACCSRCPCSSCPCAVGQIVNISSWRERRRSSTGGSPVHPSSANI
jgi:ankyrin repeat protein